MIAAKRLKKLSMLRMEICCKTPFSGRRSGSKKCSKGIWDIEGTACRKGSTCASAAIIALPATNKTAETTTTPIPLPISRLAISKNPRTPERDVDSPKTRAKRLDSYHRPKLPNRESVSTLASLCSKRSINSKNIAARVPREDVPCKRVLIFSNTVSAGLVSGDTVVPSVEVQMILLLWV